MSDEKRSRLKQWLASGEARLQPLTFPQRELWETSAVAPTGTSHHICCLINVQGLITPEACRMAVQRVVDRQEVLRLSFLPGKDGPIQMIRRSGEANIAFREISAAEGSPEGIEQLAQEIFQQPFDLMQGPLYRVAGLRRGADDHVLVLSMHHSIADGWSLGVFVRDLGAAYVQGMLGMREPLPEVPLSYSRWGAVERAFWAPAEIESRAAFWKSEFAGHRPLFDPATNPASLSGALERRTFDVSSELTAATRALARKTGATLFSTLLTAFQITLSRWTGREDIVVGTPVANRGRQTIRETMGYCSSVIPLCGRVDPSLAFTQALQTVHRSTTESFANAMPFAELARALGDQPSPGHNPVFQVRFALQNHPIPDVGVPGISAKLRMRSSGNPRCDLGCEFTEEDDAMTVLWMSRPSRFAESEILELNGLLQRVLAAACEAPDDVVAVLH